MQFFYAAIDLLALIVIGLGAGFAVSGIINLLEAYGNDSSGAKGQGIKQLIAGGGIIAIGIILVPQLKTLF